MLIEKIEAVYNEKIKNDKKEQTIFRASSCGKCQRYLAYLYHGYKPEPIPVRGFMVFELGNTIESQIVSALGSSITDAQKEVKASLDTGIEIKGHIDGIIQPDGILFDCKSINTLGFARFQKFKEVDYSYVCQANIYMKALEKDKFLFLYYNKDTSHLAEHIIFYDPEIIEQIKRRYRNILASTKDSLPAGEYEAGKTYHCGYCSFRTICKPDYVMSFEKKKPKLVLKE